MNQVSDIELYHKSRAVFIGWNPENKFIYVEWKGYASNSEYLEILDKQLDLTKQKSASKILYDLRNMGVVSADNQKYTNEVYFPKMAQAGSRYAAIIIPHNIFGEASANSILGKKNEALFEAKIFSGYESAREWLSQIV